VDDEQQWREMTETQVQVAQPTVTYEALVTSLISQSGINQRNTFYRVKRRVIKWARSIKLLAVSCTNSSDPAVLDSHLHPPGHDFPQNDQINLAPTRTASHEKENAVSGFVPVAEDGEARATLLTLPTSQRFEGFWASAQCSVMCLNTQPANHAPLLILRNAFP
jgi:hypothetical protein